MWLYRADGCAKPAAVRIDGYRLTLSGIDIFAHPIHTFRASCEREKYSCAITYRKKTSFDYAVVEHVKRTNIFISMERLAIEMGDGFSPVPLIKTAAEILNSTQKRLCAICHRQEKTLKPLRLQGFSLSKKSGWSWAFSDRYGRMGKGGARCWNAGKWIEIW